jgi:MFS family permease
MSNPRARWRVLVLLSFAELLGMSLWFSASAVAPELREQWDLGPAQAGWLTTIVQLGFVSGTAAAAVLNLADIVPARSYFAAAAILASAANAGLALAPPYETALALRFLTGFFLAAVYPPAMKMIATWFREERGLAIGTVVGALTVGKAAPFLLRGLGRGDIAPVILGTSAGAIAAAVVVLATYRDGPHGFERRPFSWALVSSVARSRETRLAVGGYLGHMWELYAMWAWIAAFLSASASAGADLGLAAPSPDAVNLWAFVAIGAGGLGCVWGGIAGDRMGRERLTSLAMAASGACALLIGPAFGRAWWLVMAVALVWGFFIVADSAQFSALVTEVAPRHAVGTALTLQTSLGFLLTMASMQLVPYLVQMVGWRWAFAMLAAGPALGIVAMQRLLELRRAAASG